VTNTRQLSGGTGLGACGQFFEHWGSGLSVGWFEHPLGDDELLQHRVSQSRPTEAGEHCEKQKQE